MKLRLLEISHHNAFSFSNLFNFSGSHPDLVPCDISNETSFMNFEKKLPTVADVQLVVGPRHRGSDIYSEWVNPAELREREYFHLGGLLVKHSRIYGQFPNPNSWVWQWFPEGDRWLQAVQQHGKDAIDRATSRFYYSLDGDSARKTAFSSLDEVDGGASFQLARNPDTNQGSLAVFQHVSANSNLATVHEQLRLSQDAGKRLGRAVPVFYSIVGSSEQSNITEKDVESACQDGNHDMVECRALPSSREPYEGETLRHLHRYCQQQPGSSVAYLQSDLPAYMKAQVSDPTEQSNLLLHLSRAALSSACIESVSQQSDNNSTCNTCGLVFYKLWTLFYPGNMFVSSCEYINQILPPKIFEQRMQEYIQETLIQRLYDNLQSNIFQGAARTYKDVTRLKENNDIDRMEVLGLDRFSVDFWLGSHPNILPCDVSGSSEQDLTYWRGLPGTTEAGKDTDKQTLASAQHEYGPVVPALTHDFGSPFFFNRAVYDRVMANPRLRVPEVTFLAGHVFRWFQLYGKVPDASSPIWSWFPDSELWKEAAAREGIDVVEKNAARFRTAK
jgi:hypothetical protein